MALLTVLGTGLPSTSRLFRPAAQESIQKAIEAMDSDMIASPYDWELFYVTPDMEYEVLLKKLREKQWDNRYDWE